MMMNADWPNSYKFNTVCVYCFVDLLTGFWYLERNVDWLNFLSSTPVGVFSLGCVSVEFGNVGKLFVSLSAVVNFNTSQCV